MKRAFDQMTDATILENPGITFQHVSPPAHPNVVLFITHGGLLSTTETLHFGVPIIGIPLFADQFINIKRAVKKGFGKHVVIGYDADVKLKEAIDDIFQDPM